VAIQALIEYISDNNTFHFNNNRQGTVDIAGTTLIQRVKTLLVRNSREGKEDIDTLIEYIIYINLNKRY